MPNRKQFTISYDQNYHWASGMHSTVDVNRNWSRHIKRTDFLLSHETNWMKVTPSPIEFFRRNRRAAYILLLALLFCVLFFTIFHKNTRESKLSMLIRSIPVFFLLRRFIPQFLCALSQFRTIVECFIIIIIFFWAMLHLFPSFSVVVSSTSCLMHKKLQWNFVLFFLSCLL